MATERLTVKSLKAGDFVRRQTFLVTDVKELTTKNGKPYISFIVGDKTGSINGVCWDTFPIVSSWVGDPREIVQSGLKDLAGDITEYNGKLQLKATYIGPATTTEMHHFEKCSEYDAEAMWPHFEEYVQSFKNGSIRTLAHRLVTTYAEEFKSKPAATGMHHAFKHGLLEHTLQMLDTANALFKLPFYSKDLNKDYCMFGIMFHDFGKIFEYGDGPDFKKTVSGILVPHIPRMAAIIEKEATALDMDEEMMLYLQSIVLSHHRFMDWGSPVKPASPEALFVHYIDNLHGDVFGALQKLESDTSSEPVVKYGFGEQSYTLVKKRFSEVVGEEKKDDKVRSADNSAGEETDLVGF